MVELYSTLLCLGLHYTALHPTKITVTSLSCFSILNPDSGSWSRTASPFLLPGCFAVISWGWFKSWESCDGWDNYRSCCTLRFIQNKKKVTYFCPRFGFLFWESSPPHHVYLVSTGSFRTESLKGRGFFKNNMLLTKDLGSKGLGLLE